MQILDFSQWRAGGNQRSDFLKQLLSACRNDGFFYLKNHSVAPNLCEDTLSVANAFFDLPPSEKEANHIRHSNNFRGYSIMKNERDWREQFHFGWEWMDFEFTEDLPTYYRLAGSNPFPPTLGESTKSRVLEFMAAMNQLGHELLRAIATALGLKEDAFTPNSTKPDYLLMKFICYYPQPNGQQRPGVAAHCDWSWLTLLLQDNIGGLEILDEETKWQPARPLEGCLSVNLGELLEIATNGLLRATPHRVINPSNEQKRVSIPIFINPPLNTIVAPVMEENRDRNPVLGHVHRVVEHPVGVQPFVFGESEWKRKGLGQWCYRADCLK